jgi:hypothetical protein
MTTMPSVYEVELSDLCWVYVRGSELRYELLAGDSIVARLDLPCGHGATQALAEAAEGRWILEHTGMMLTKVVVRPPEAGDATTVAGALADPPPSWVTANWRVRSRRTPAT